MAFQGGLKPGLFPTRELRRARVLEIAPEVWFIEGYLSDNFLARPPSCNCFILRDHDLVLLIDTGTYPFFRAPLLKVLARFRREGARRLCLMLTQGHFDHVANNDIILEAGYEETVFKLPQIELTTIDLRGHWNQDAADLSAFYDPFTALPPRGPSALVHYAGRISPRLAAALYDFNCRVLFRGIRTLAQRAQLLTPQTMITRTFGDVSLRGWEVGRFFAIHDGAHSPGHLSFYDPENKLLLTGDATLEINPPFFNGSMDQCIKMMGQFQRLAEQGFVTLATDAHRSTIWTQELMNKYGYEPLHRLQALDLVCGREDCAGFYRFFREYYQVLRDEVLQALARLKEAALPEIVEEFYGSVHPYVQFKKLIAFPRLPSRTEVMVANVLKEAGATPRREGKRIVFRPPLPERSH
jgi:glyoxylase-like metal-dependent hydrolase (beta-lactamase superfamily II)